MAHVTIPVAGRTYRVGCGDSDAARLQVLAGDLGKRIELVRQEHGAVGEDRLVLMTALLVLDELWELRERMDARNPAPAGPSREHRAAAGPAHNEAGSGRAGSARQSRRSQS